MPLELLRIKRKGGIILKTNRNLNLKRNICRYKDYAILEEGNSENGLRYYLIEFEEIGEIEICYEIDYEEFKKLRELFKDNNSNPMEIENKINEAIKENEKALSLR